MRIKLTLLALVGAGLGLSLYPPLRELFPDSLIAKPVRLWKESLLLVGVPAALFFVSFSKGIASRAANVFWGLWVVGVSVGVLASRPGETPYQGYLGISFVVTTLTLGLALVLFALMMKPKTSKKPTVQAADETRSNAENSQPS